MVSGSTDRANEGGQAMELQRHLDINALTTAPVAVERKLPNPSEEIFDQGLAFDLETLMDRRQVIKLIGGAGMAAGILTILGCTPGAILSSASTSGSSATTTAGSDTSCDPIPEETAGPYPGDGSNGPDVLTESGVVRSDIRTSFGSSTGTAEGVPLTIKLTIQDDTNKCAPLAGAAVYLWHCNREGLYSLYSQGATDQNYLRGVQESDSSGVVTFTSIFPACYSGRWPHIHFEVYPSLAKATDQASKIATSQLALPKDTCDTVYATDGYSQSVTNLAQVTLASDNVFGNDAGVHQVGTVSGSVDGGYTVTLAVPVTPA
jgi:protocatechuate 3,4-dioxygenase beta subunit